MLDLGDHAIAAVFDSAAGALSAAVGCLRAADGDDRRLGDHSAEVRIGVDIGDVERTSGSWSGRALARAAAISGVASNNQILCTSVLAELASEDIQADLRVVDLGMFRISEIPPVSLHRVVGEGMEDGDTAVRASRVAGRRIPGQVEHVIGRDRELELVIGDLEQSRLVSVVGPGGVAANGGAAYRATLKQGLAAHFLATDPLAAIRAYEEAIEITERHGLLFGLMGAHQGLVFAAASASDPREALSTMCQLLRFSFVPGFELPLARSVRPAAGRTISAPTRKLRRC